MHPASPSPADRLSALIVRLVSAMFARRVGAYLGFIPVPVMTLLTTRLRKVSQRFRRLADRIQAGWVYQPKPPTSRKPPADPPPDKPPRKPADQPAAPPASGSERSLAQCLRLLRLLPDHDLETIKREFRHLLLFDPEMQAVMQAAPGPAWQILRPLCRTIGIPRPDILAPPPRPKVEKPPKPPKAPKPPRPRQSRKDYFGWLEEREFSFSAHWPRGVPGKPRTA